MNYRQIPSIGLLGMLCAFALPMNAQQIKNVRAEFDGEKIILSYDLIAEHPEDKFKIVVFSSHDNYQKPLSLLVGDAGDNISPGNGNRATWDAKSALPPDFNSEVILKIKASIMISIHDPFRLDLKPLDFNSYKRGGVLNLEWNGGKEGEQIKIELYKNGELLEKIAETGNSNIFSWSIPKKTKPGKEYSIRIAKATDSNISDVTQDFQIKPGAPLWLKLGPIILVGGIVAIIISAQEDEVEPELPDLPGPINPG